MSTLKLVGNQIVLNDTATMDRSKFVARSVGSKVYVSSTDPGNRQRWVVQVGDTVGGSVRSTISALFGAVNALAGQAAPTTAEVSTALKAKPAIAALVSPTSDFANLAAATAAVKAVVDALQA